MKVILVVPTRNESENIKNFSRALKVLKNVPFVVCFVDGSEDNKTTIEIKKNFKKNFKIIKEKKRFNSQSSRCSASRLGFKWAVKQKKCKIIIDIDCDLANDPSEIKNAIKLIKKYDYDIILTSKYLKGSIIIGRTLFRRFLSKFYTVTCKVFISSKITDYSNSYRFYKKQGLKDMLSIPMKYTSPIQHLENLKFFINNQYKITEIKTKYVERKKGNSAIKFNHLLIYFFDFIKSILSR
tara:strand:- start:3009 stop:3725 length:717 start_codon:yes stop_codon:yes gene_type:complete